MTSKEREIREAERKAMAEVRRWKINTAKRLAAMSPQEKNDYFKNMTRELKAEGFNVVNFVKS